MNKIKQIKALFLLSIISILMFHTAVPHVHHIHTKEQKSDHEHVHLDDHGSHAHHNHNHGSSEEQEDNNLLSNILDELAHGVHDNEYISTDHTVNLAFISKIDLVPIPELNIDIPVSSPQLERNNLHLNALYKQKDYSNPFLLTCSLRAPPVLG